MSVPKHGLPDEMHDLVVKACDGDDTAMAELFDHFRPRLMRMVEVRIDPRLSGRVDAADVLQETFLDVVQGAKDYAKHEDFPFFLWLRLMTGRRLMNTHRQHLGAQKRNAAMEVKRMKSAPDATSMSIANFLVGNMTSASRVIQREESKARLAEALEEMDPIDREVITLRHLEELSNNEIAQELGLTKAAASNRYVRALTRLKKILGDTSDFTI
ncbi:MAG: sigma-70 family RNA polymerase sigma factor [Planctomycetales bacterium]|nr:sigma-70 family RNA polymerase sigma factor [Planctomycetales bacterium]